MDHNDLTGLFATVGTFGGIALIIWTSMMGKIARIKAEAEARRITAAPLPQSASEGSVLAEIKAMRQQMEQMQSTSHQFDISFDEALNRMESRVSRLETKSATTGTVPQTDTPNTLRNGQS
jgi:hypothetical protein